MTSALHRAQGPDFDQRRQLHPSRTGGGYAATADTAHVAVRQAEGNSSVTARITSLSGATTPFAGVTMRETLLRGSKRVVLGTLTGTGLQMRTRSSAGVTDAVTATVAGIVPTRFG